jgi:hypothetical protein
MKFTCTRSADLAIDDAARLLADPVCIGGFDPVGQIVLTPRSHDDEGNLATEALWNLVFRWRGAMRRITTRRLAAPGPRGASYRLQGRQLEADIIFDLAPGAHGGTQVTLTCDLQPKTIGLRLILEPFRVARGRAQARFEAGFETLVRHLERQARPEGAAAAAQGRAGSAG